jgi:hypothetical protein
MQNDNDDDDEQWLLNLPSDDKEEGGKAMTEEKEQRQQQQQLTHESSDFSTLSTGDKENERTKESTAAAAASNLQTESSQSIIESEGLIPTTTPTKKRPSITPSTSASSITVVPSTTSKKIKITETMADKTDADLPRFLSRTTEDIFQETIKSHLTGKQRTAGSRSIINIEQLRKIALLKFYIAINELDVSLWTAYLQSGTGNLEELESSKNEPRQQAAAAAATKNVKLLRWPSDLKNKMIASGFISTQDDKRIDGHTYLEYVNKQIRYYQDKNTQYENDLKEEKQRLANSFTIEIEEIIDQFIEQHGTSFHRIPINGQISTIRFKYQDRLVELEFHEQSPREYQLDVFQNISKLKYTKETAKMNVAVLKQRLFYNHLPSSFESLHIPESITLQTIQDDAIRQHLSERYHKVLQRTKSDMFI